MGYKVSCAKVQMVETKVTYLRVQITHGSRRLSSDRVSVVLIGYQNPPVALPHNLKTTVSFSGVNWVL